MCALFDYESASLFVQNFCGTPLSLWADADDNLQLRLDFEFGLTLPLSVIDRFRALSCGGRKSIAVVNRKMDLEWTTAVDNFASGDSELGWHSCRGMLGPVNL